ncbi:retrovirus-related pol polyprotein from transposon TNT 1-94 [Tanacetum coccineum]
MTGNRSQLMNFVSKFLGTVRFGNDQIARIMGYGDYQLGNVVISRRNTYFIRNLEGVDLLSGSRGTNLYTISPDDMLRYSLICLLSKASKTKSWKLYLLHMDLCGPMRVASINGKKVYLSDSRRLLKIYRADVGIFVGYAPVKKAFRIYNRRTRIITETIHVTFDELTTMASEQFSSGPGLHAEVLADSPVSTFIDQDAPSTSISSSQEYEQSPIISQGFEESPKIPTFHDDPLNESPNKDSTSHGSSSNVRQIHTPLEHIGRWTNDHPIANMIVEPKNFKQAMTEPSWIDAMQEEIHEFERLEVWELVPCPDNVFLIKLKWIDKVKIDESGGDNPSHVYKLKKALYSLKQAPHAWYNMLSSFLISQQFSTGAVDPILFTPRTENDILLVQIYVDDIIFASTNTAMCDEFANQMTSKFKMSMMGQMSFFLGLQISQSPRGIFINQSKYASEIGKLVDATLYRGMIGSLIYLTASRPVLNYAVCLCARYQAKPTEKHLQAVKRIFRYLNGTINMGLWYSKDTDMSLTAYADTDHAGCQDTRRSTSGSARFIGDRLVSWSSKKQKSTAISNYGFQFNKIPLYYDNKSAIALCCNNIQHSRAKHIDIRYHFIKEQVENGIVELCFIRTAIPIADILY